MSQQVDIKLNGAKVNPNTVASAIYDAARDQALSASLINLIEKNALGFPAFSTLTAYAVGNKVFHDRKLWKFVQAHAAGAWNAQHVQEFSIKEYCDAIDEKVDINYNDLDNRKANIDGYYETMVVGTAKNLEGQNVTEGTFFARPTGGENAELANGLAQIQAVKGNSVKYNQLIQNGNFADGTTWWTNKVYNATLTIESGRLKISGTTQYLTSVRLSILIPTHKYLCICDTYSKNGSWRLAVSNGALGNVTEYKSISSGRVKFIFTSTTTATTLSIQLVDSSGDIVLNNFQLFDLTALGIDNLTTAAQVEAWMAANWGAMGYYPNSAGSVLNVNMTGIESFKRNLLNPTTGKAYILGAYSETYGNYYGICGTYGTLTFNDIYGNESTITPDADGKFELAVAGELTVADAGADCAVFLWWDGTETEYSEYGSNVAKLDITHIYGKLNGAGELVRVWPTGAPGLGTLQDYLKLEDGAVVAKRVMGEVDLGTLTWSINNQKTTVFEALVTGDRNSHYRYICTKYPVDNSAIGWGDVRDKYLVGRGDVSNPKIYIQDTAYSDAATFKTAMSGVLLYYELATPETYTDLVYMNSELFEDGTPVTLPVNYEADNWGIERVLPLNTSEAMVTSAPTIESKYSLDAVEQLDTHSAEIADLYNKNALLNEQKANKVGEYPDMVVGSAAALKGDTAQSAEFVFRPTGSPDKVASGIAQMEAIKGKSLVWNQLVANGNFASSSGWQYTYATTTFANNSVTLTKEVISGTNYSHLYRSIPTIPIGHKVFMCIEYASSRTGVYFELSNTTGQKTARLNLSNTNLQRTILTGVLTTADLESKFVDVVDYADYALTLIVYNIQIIDLTLMYGAGNEPTAAQFEAMYPLKYYAFNAGTLINNKTTGIEAVGFNQWDEDWEEGVIDNDTGNNYNLPDRVRSKNHIRVIPGQTYYFKTPSGKGLYLYCYDNNKQYIGRPLGTAAFSNTTLTIPAGCGYIRFVVNTGYTTYKNDICINLSDASKNGTYEPYKKSTLELNIPTLTGKLNGEGESVVICADGMRSAGTAFDEGVVENGYLTKIVKCIGQQVVSGAIGDTITLTGCDTNATTFLCAKEIGTLSGGVLTLSAAASNVEVYFPLAEPQVYVLDTPIPVNYQVDGDGTERRLPEDTASEVNAPFAADIRYSMDAVGTLNDLPKNFDSAGGLDDLCSALATALGGALNGTLSIQRGAYNATTQKYAWTVTFTPNE